MKAGIISDIHLYRKTERLVCALNALDGVEMLLIAGDLADRALPEQYSRLEETIREFSETIPVYCVSGNHDNPARDDANYRAFERKINAEAMEYSDESGAFYKQLSRETDLTGLNLTYYQKQFFFPDKGKHLEFLQKKMNESSAMHHIVLCHPPLIAHNPLRTVEATPYLAKEQNDWLQNLVDGQRNVIFISGHTHVAPEVEVDETRGNIYINNGSICPTAKNDGSGGIQQGNVTFLEIDGGKVSVRVVGIHTGKGFCYRELCGKNGAVR